MIIKVGDEYLDFSGDIIIEKQLFSFETLSTAGTFSYSFTVPDTYKNRKILGVLNISNNEQACFVDNVQIQTDGGIPLFIGYINVTNPIAIDCSFFSDNNNFFSKISGNCIDLDLSDFDLQLNEDAIVNSWTASNGIVFPVMDIGILRDRNDRFMFNDIDSRTTVFESEPWKLAQSDFHPFIFVKDIINEIMSQSGLKIAGDLVKDSNYQNLITTNSLESLKKSIIAEQNIYVASKTPQVSPNTTPSIIVFDLSDAPYFQSELGNWNAAINRFDSSYQCVFEIDFSATVSDVTKETHFSFRQNGIEIYNAFVSGSTPNPVNYKGYRYFNAVDYFEVYSWTSGATNNINTCSLKIKATNTNYIFARTLCPNISNKEFIADVFKMFNVLANYDPYSNTINTVLYKNITQYDEQDLSEYIHDIPEVRNYDLISNYAQRNTILYESLGGDDIDKYNESNEDEWGSGSFNVSNRSLEEQKDIAKIGFSAPFAYNSKVFDTYFSSVNFVEIDNEDFEYDITSVSDYGGLAQFNTGTGIQYVFFNLPYSGNATCKLRQIEYKRLETEKQVICLYLANTELRSSFRFSGSGDVFYNDGSVNSGTSAWRIVDSTLINYNGVYQLYDDTGSVSPAPRPDVQRSTVGIAVFAKKRDGSEMDILRQGLSFGEITGFDSLTMTETYYNALGNSLNNPFNPIVEFLFPENVFLNLDLTKAIRLKTSKFNGLFIANKLTGYKDSVTPCTIELIQIQK